MSGWLRNRGRSYVALIPVLVLASACLSSAGNNTNATFSVATAPLAAPSMTPTPVAQATLVSKPQPDATGLLLTGVITLNGDPPPPGSTLYLGLVTSAADAHPRTCIDAQNNPVNDVGQFYAQVACTPRSGEKLLYVLIIGDPGQRNWHRGVINFPADPTNFRIATT